MIDRIMLVNKSVNVRKSVNMWLKRRKKTPIYEEKRVKNWVGTAKKAGFSLKKIKKFTKFNTTASNM